MLESTYSLHSYPLALRHYFILIDHAYSNCDTLDRPILGEWIVKVFIGVKFHIDFLVGEIKFYRAIVTL